MSGGIKLQPREKVIVLVALLCVAGYGFYTFWFSPYQTKIDAAKQKSAEYQAEINKNQAVVAKAKELEAHKAEIESKAANLQGQLPMVDALPVVMNDIKNILQANGVEVKHIELVKGAQKKTLDPGLEYRAVKVTFASSYSAAAAGVKALENTAQRTFTVTGLSITRKPPAVEGSMTVELYFAKNPLPGFGYQPLLEKQGKADPFAG